LLFLVIVKLVILYIICFSFNLLFMKLSFQEWIEINHCGPKPNNNCGSLLVIALLNLFVFHCQN